MDHSGLGAPENTNKVTIHFSTGYDFHSSSASLSFIFGCTFCCGSTFCCGLSFSYKGQENVYQY